MSDEQPQTSRPLRWWFWLVLVAPVLVSLSPAMFVPLRRVGMGIVFLNLYVALPLNFVCSNWAAKQIVLRRDPRGGSSPWMFPWGPSFFFLNVALVFGGCSALEQFARSAR